MPTHQWCSLCGRSHSQADHQRYCQREPATVRTLQGLSFSFQELKTALERDLEQNGYRPEQRIQIRATNLKMQMRIPEEIRLENELENLRGVLRELEGKQALERASLEQEIWKLSKELGR